MNNLRILPYAMGSQSAKDLANHLNCLRVFPDGEYIPRMQQSVVNWGCSQNPSWSQRAALRGVRILNKPQSVKVAANKLHTLTELRRAGVDVPDFTTNMFVAQAWLDRGHIVFERHSLTGNSGEGIQIVSSDLDPEDPSIIRNFLSPAPLYTKYVNKTTEFRVHVFRGEVIDYIEKKKMASERRPAGFNPYVSSVNVGWVFARNNILDCPRVRAIAIAAVNALGLDFGAVDIAYAEGNPFVLEVNTAPGLHGTTLVKYVNAVRRYMGAAPLSQNEVDEIMSQAGIEQDTPIAASSALDDCGSEDCEDDTLAISVPVGESPTWQSRSSDRNAHMLVQPGLEDEVLLRLDKQTALKLKHLLAAIV
jgi:glutathione synthase/RimK-type ligase-like ATP-grasp enzyme